MVGERYAGFENLNSYRNYPFSETADLNDVDGVVLAEDVFVDAFLYPIVDEMSSVSLTLVDFSKGGYVEAKVSNGQTLSGRYDGNAVELYDFFDRHVGTIMPGPGWDREMRSMRARTFKGVEFAPSAVSPIVHPGVYSMSNEEESERTTRRNIVLVGDGCITPVLENKPYGPELHFDVQDDYVYDMSPVVHQILFAAVGRTLFDIQDQSEDTVLATTPSMDREDVCWQAHQEDAVAAIVDTCDDSNDYCPPSQVPFKIQEIWKCPSEVGDVNLVAEDIVGLKNSLHIVPVEGGIKAVTPQITEGMNAETMAKEGAKLLERPKQVGNGIRITIPGLQNGR